VPATQLAQVDEAVAPVEVENEPAGHDEQAVDPVKDA
jgi:hypothetical protein